MYKMNISLFCFSSGMQWIMYSSISDKVKHFYHVTDNSVNWMSACWEVVYIVSYYINKYKSTTFDEDNCC